MELRSITFKYLLGDFVLFRAGFSLSVTKLGFCADQPSLDIRTAVDLLPASADGLAFFFFPVREKLPRLTLLPGAIRYVRDHYKRFYIDLSGTFEEYLEKFPSKARYNLKTPVKKFTAYSGGTIHWRIFRKPEEVAEFHKLAREIAATTYQDRLLDAAIPEGDEFRVEMEELASRDCMRGYILYDNKKMPIAYLYFSSRDGVAEPGIMGYDPGYSRYSPGTVLLYCVLSSLFSEGSYHFFDFGQGEGGHKKLFATNSDPCADIYFFRKTFRNLTLVSLHLLVNDLSGFAGRMLEAMRIKSVIRKIIRKQA